MSININITDEKKKNVSITKFQSERKIIQSAAVPIELENIDTDQIIPARFLKATTRDGFGKNLSRYWSEHRKIQECVYPFKSSGNGTEIFS